MGLFDIFKPKNIQPEHYDLGFKQTTPVNTNVTGTQAPASDFEMLVEDVFSITGRGTVVTGRINKGSVRVGDNIRIYSNGNAIPTVVTAIEMFRKSLDVANEGENCGIALQGVSRNQVHRGDFLIK